MKHVEVVCAIITNENNEILCCRRGPGRALEGKWEFPGGKVENNETKEEALVREIKEELKMDISVIEYLGDSYYEYYNLSPYKDFSITMYGFKCEICCGIPLLTEHTELIWMKKEKINDLDFAEADKPFLELISEKL